jgi:hypothetical protein
MLSVSNAEVTILPVCGLLGCWIDSSKREKWERNRKAFLPLADLPSCVANA